MTSTSGNRIKRKQQRQRQKQQQLKQPKRQKQSTTPTRINESIKRKLTELKAEGTKLGRPSKFEQRRPNPEGLR